MLRRIKNLIGIHTNELLDTLHRPIPTLKYACKQLKKQAVRSYVKAIELERKAEGLPSGEVKTKVLAIASKLKGKAKEYKDKYKEYTNKIAEFEGRIEVAKMTIELSQYGSDDSPLDLIRDVEEEVLRVESEAKAILEFENL